MAGRKSKKRLDMHDVQDWQHILNDVGDELNLLREDIQMRNKRLQSGGDVAKLNATIRKALQHVERDLIDLKDALSDFRHELPEREIARRRDECDYMMGVREEVMKSFRRSNRQNVFGAATDIDPYHPDKEPSHIKDLENQEVLALQTRVMEEQDKGLDELSKALERTQHVGIAIGDELDEHALLLDTLGDEVDRADRGITRQAKRVTELMKKSSVFFGIVIIIILAVVLILLIALAIFLR